MPESDIGCAAPSNALPGEGRRWLQGLAHRFGARPRLALETLALLASLWFVLVANAAFWRGVASSGVGTGAFVALGVAMLALHWLLIGLVAWGRLAKGVIALLVVAAAVASYYSSRYGVHFDADMTRNMVHTDTSEARELLDPAMLLRVAASVALPLLVLWRVRLHRRSLSRAAASRFAWLVLAVVVLIGALLADYREVSSLMRTQPKLRYLVAPGNLMVSAVSIGLEAAAGPAGPKASIGRDARVLARRPGRRPRAVVLVVGETLRAMNWGLNGYVRQTTPRLAEASVFNFGDVTACGTSTEVSLPCMFSLQGRRHYDRRAIRDSESVLHVLGRAGIPVHWRDNQTGCKGVCDGLAFTSFLHAQDARYCEGGRCYDEILFAGLPRALAAEPGDVVIVLHMLGNHGPTYSRRYPAGFEQFRPVCTAVSLGECTPESIVNAYDNAILYTDWLLAQAIDELAQVRSHDTALLYVSDHGESLGEGGLYLHGIPSAIAPEEQLKVPMLLWFSPAWVDAGDVNTKCMSAQSRQPASHDNLPHTLLGLLQVHTSVYDPTLDLIRPCT